MKTILKNLSIFVLGILIFSSCDDLGKTKLKIDTSFDVLLPVVISPGKGAFAVLDTINILENPDLIAYTDQINDIEIQSVTFEVISLNPDSLILTDAHISASVTDLPCTSWALNNQTLLLGSVINLENSNNQFGKTKTIFLSQRPIAVSFYGNTDVDTATFTVKVTFNTEVTVLVETLN